MGGVTKTLGSIGKGALSIGSGFLTGGPMGAIASGAELLGGLASNNQQKQNAKAQQQQYNTAMGAVQGPSQYEQMMQQWMQQQKAPGQFDVTQNQGFNAGQDALMQMVNRNPAQQLGAAGSTLENLSQTGAAQNAQSLVDQLQPLQQMQGQQQMASLNAGVSGLGQRLGSAQAIGQARLGAQLAAQNNAQNAGIYQSTYENAANRQLQAANSLGSLLQQGQGQQLQAAQGLGQYANMAMQGNQNNNAQQLAFQQMMQGGYGQLMGAQNQRTGQLVGLNAPQAQTSQPLVGAIQSAAALPSVFQQLQRLNQQPQQRPMLPSPGGFASRLTAPSSLFGRG